MKRIGFSRSANTISRWAVPTLALAGVGLAASAVPAATVTFQDGQTVFGSTYDGTEDTYVSGNRQDDNFGDFNDRIVTSDFSQYDRNGLVRWDVSSLQGQALSIDSASVTLTAERSDSNHYFNVYEISEPNADWIEGDQGFVTGDDNGGSTWDFKQDYNDGTPDVPWAGSEGLETAGADYETPALATQVGPTTEGESGGLATFSIPTSLVQEWSTGTSAQNEGLLLMGRSSGFEQYRSSEYSTVAERPALTVEYTPIPEPASLALLALGGLAMLGRKRRRRA